MTSRFVSGGIIAGDNAAPNPPPAPAAAASPTSTKVPQTSAKNSEWEIVQRNLEEERRRREETRKANIGSAGGGEKSLFEVLQANKEAKQAAFEEANKIRNQFRALDDYEADFLDGVVEEERREEDRRRRETEQGLREFREAQKKISGGPAELEDGEDVLEGAGADEWAAGAGGPRKRKREKEGIIKGLKRRVSEGGKQSGAASDRTSDATAAKAGTLLPKAEPKKSTVAQESPAKVDATPKAAVQKPKMGLVDYGSDEDDDD